MHNRYEHVTSAFSSICRSIQKIERDVMEKYGCKGAYAQYLAAIRRYPDGVTSAQLSEICAKDKAAVSRMVAELESKGFITRENSSDNMYRARITLTEDGADAADYVVERASAAIGLIGKDLSDENRRIFYETLDVIAEKLHKISGDGLPE